MDSISKNVIKLANLLNQDIDDFSQNNNSDERLSHIDDIAQHIASGIPKQDRYVLSRLRNLLNEAIEKYDLIYGHNLKRRDGLFACPICLKETEIVRAYGDTVQVACGCSFLSDLL